MENNLKILRIKAGLTQKELAESANIPQSKISVYENIEDLSNITIGILMKISDVLGVTINDIVYPIRR